MQDNLFPTLNSSSLHLFHQSEKNRMTIESHRHSQKHGMVVETTSIYRKGKINPNRINFTIKYSEYYLLADRKKSIGKYELGEGGLFKRYERSDFNSRNIRKWTFQHYFTYEYQVVKDEAILTTEYLSEGSAEIDTAQYLDSVKFTLSKEGNVVKQVPTDDPSVYTEFVIENDLLVSKTNYFEGFSESFVYRYNDQNQLVKIENTLKGKEDKDIFTHTDLSYNSDGLLAEVRFYDEKEVLLEKKIFTYK